jgi:hypothetical protein
LRERAFKPLAVLGSVAATGLLVVSLIGISIGEATASATPHEASAVSNASFTAMLETGRLAAAKGTVEFGEILGISSPGGGEMLRVHTVYNAAKGIQASAIDEISGLLRSDAKAIRSISVQTLVIGKTGYVRPTTAGAKWTKEDLQPTASSTSALPSELLKLAGPHAVARSGATGTSTSYRIDLRASDLAVLRAFASQLPSRTLASLSKVDVRLLSGVVLSAPDLVITLDREDRLTQLKLGGTLTETRADAKARHTRYPRGGVEGVVLLNLVYAYGGALRVTAPPASQILNRKPLR